jgi:hypothetical protein
LLFEELEEDLLEELEENEELELKEEDEEEEELPVETIILPAKFSCPLYVPS